MREVEKRNRKELSFFFFLSLSQKDFKKKEET